MLISEHPPPPLTTTTTALPELSGPPNRAGSLPACMKPPAGEAPGPCMHAAALCSQNKDTRERDPLCALTLSGCLSGGCPTHSGQVVACLLPSDQALCRQGIGQSLGGGGARDDKENRYSERTVHSVNQSGSCRVACHLDARPFERFQDMRDMDQDMDPVGRPLSVMNTVVLSGSRVTLGC